MSHGPGGSLVLGLHVPSKHSSSSAQSAGLPQRWRQRCWLSTALHARPLRQSPSSRHSSRPASRSWSRLGKHPPNVAAPATAKVKVKVKVKVNARVEGRPVMCCSRLQCKAPSEGIAAPLTAAWPLWGTQAGYASGPPPARLIARALRPCGSR